MKVLWLFLAVFFFLASSHGRPFHGAWGISKRNDQPDPWGSAHRPDEIDFGKKLVTTVYRADSRSPDEIRRVGGFFARPGPDTTSRYNLFNHVMGNLENTAFVSTTEEVSVAAGYANNIKLHPDNMAKKAYIYKIQTSSRFIDMNRSIRIMKGSSGVEHAAMLAIPRSQIISFAEATDDVLANIATIKFEDNPDFKAVRKPGSTTRPELALFPPNHPAWKAKPWSKYKRPIDLVKEFDKVLATVQESSPSDAGSSEAQSKQRSQRARKLLRQKAKSKGKPRHDADDNGPPEDGESPSDDGQDDQRAKAERARRLRQKDKLKPKEQSGDDGPPPDTASSSEGGSSGSNERSRAQRAKDWLLRKNKNKKTERKRPDGGDGGHSDAPDRPGRKPSKPRQKNGKGGR